MYCDTEAIICDWCKRDDSILDYKMHSQYEEDKAKKNECFLPVSTI